MENPQIIPPNYVCEKCNYVTSSKKDFNKHMSTSKHINRTFLNNLSQKNPSNLFCCKYCSKEYKVRNSLWYHEKKCKISEEKSKNTEENIVLTTEEKEESYEEKQQKTEEELKELKTMFIKMIEINQDLQKQIVELAKETKSITNNNNTTNNNLSLIHI
jgi:hypothetical protein